MNGSPQAFDKNSAAEDTHDLAKALYPIQSPAAGNTIQGPAVGEIGARAPAANSLAVPRQSVPKKLIAALDTVLAVLFRKSRHIGSRYLLKAKLKPHPAIIQAISPALEKQHQTFWRPLAVISPLWLRYYVNVSGIKSPHYVPGDVYFSIIDHRLNNADYNDLYNDKNNLERLFGSDNMPETVLRRVCGVFAHASYQTITGDLPLLPPQDLILKPSCDTSSGQGIKLLRYRHGQHRDNAGLVVNEQYLRTHTGAHFIIQKLLSQHAFCAQFNAGSINTFRVFTYRSVKDEQTHILRVVLKTGHGDSVVDNQVMGGVVCVADSSGMLGRYAASVTGQKHLDHPVSGVVFAGKQIPHFDRITALALKVASTVQTHRTLGLDIALDSDGLAKLIEVNPMGVALDIMQCDGGPLFGEFTTEVRDYCIAHPENERKKIIRP